MYGKRCYFYLEYITKHNHEEAGKDALDRWGDKVNSTAQRSGKIKGRDRGTVHVLSRVIQMSGRVWETPEPKPGSCGLRGGNWFLNIVSKQRVGGRGQVWGGISCGMRLVWGVRCWVWAGVGGGISLDESRREGRWWSVKGGGRGQVWGSLWCKKK